MKNNKISHFENFNHVSHLNSPGLLKHSFKYSYGRHHPLKAMLTISAKPVTSDHATIS